MVDIESDGPAPELYSRLALQGCGEGRATFKHLRTTAHTHHPVDDAKSNSEALLAIKRDFGLKIDLT